MKRLLALLVGAATLALVVGTPPASARIRDDYTVTWSSNRTSVNDSHHHAFNPVDAYWAVHVSLDCFDSFPEANWAFVNYNVERINDAGTSYNSDWRTDSLYIDTNWGQREFTYYYHTPDRTTLINGNKPFKVDVGGSTHTQNGDKTCSWTYWIYDYHCTQGVCPGRGAQSDRPARHAIRR